MQSFLVKRTRRIVSCIVTVLCLAATFTPRAAAVEPNAVSTPSVEAKPAKPADEVDEHHARDPRSRAGSQKTRAKEPGPAPISIGSAASTTGSSDPCTSGTRVTSFSMELCGTERPHRGQARRRRRRVPRARLSARPRDAIRSTPCLHLYHRRVPPLRPDPLQVRPRRHRRFAFTSAISTSGFGTCRTSARSSSASSTRRCRSRP